MERRRLSALILSLEGFKNNHFFRRDVLRITSALSAARFTNHVSSSNLNNLLLYGVLDQLPPVMQIQFAHQVAAVGLDCFDGKAQDAGDFPIRMTLGDQLQDLPLARSQVGGILGRPDISPA